MVVSFIYILTGDTGINPDLVDSTINKLFFGMFMVGCGMLYGTTSICLFVNRDPLKCLFANRDPLKHKTLGVVWLISCFCFFGGLSYFFILQSPW